MQQPLTRYDKLFIQLAFIGQWLRADEPVHGLARRVRSCKVDAAIAQAVRNSQGAIVAGCASLVSKKRQDAANPNNTAGGRDARPCARLHVFIGRSSSQESF
jgi:hypothetical protein